MTERKVVMKRVSELREGDETPWYKCLENVRNYGDGSFAIMVQYTKDGGISMREWDEFAQNPEIEVYAD